MDQKRCDAVIQFALLVAGRQDDLFERELGPIHLLKYVYLADLAHAERHAGETFTGARWRFYHYGPWAAEVHDRIDPALAALHADKKTIESTLFDDDFVRWSKVDDEVYEELERELPQSIVTALGKAVRRYGKDTTELLHHVYTTRPMLRAKPNTELMFRVAEPTEHDTPARPRRTMTAKQEKKRNARVKETKERIRVKLAERRAARSRKKLSPPPRYDDVYAQGLAWLDAVAGDERDELELEAVFDDSVWDSDTRGEARD